MRMRTNSNAWWIDTFVFTAESGRGLRCYRNGRMMNITKSFCVFVGKYAIKLDVMTVSDINQNSEAATAESK
jgi:hypothetical protein